MSWYWLLILGIVEAVAAAIIISHVKKSQKKRDDHIEARKKESMLSLDLQIATAKLSYAIAMAWKRGTPNGEVEEGVEAYEKAMDKYQQFLNEQAAEHIIN